MQSSLIPERPLIISPTLAATIGLEEAVLLHVFCELMAHRRGIQKDGLIWLELDQQSLLDALPFWAWIDIRRVQNSLQEIGLLLVDPNTGRDDSWRFAINQPDAAPSTGHRDGARPDAAQSGAGRMTGQQATGQPTTGQHPSGHHASARHISSQQRTPFTTDVSVSSPAGSSRAVPAAPSARQRPQGGAEYIALDWQPGEDWLALCRQHGIPDDFTRSLVPGFVMYWRDRAQSRFSWGNAFYRHALREWRQEQTRRGAGEMDTAMTATWRPNQDAIDILTRAGVNEAFIEDAVPEFVLYWRERGAQNGAWNTRFIEHIRRQWARYQQSLQHDGLPRPIPEDWQPAEDVFEVLRLAEIDEVFARTKVAEFVLYWRDTGQVHASWNTRFLQFIKYSWARRLETGRTGGGQAGAQAAGLIQAGNDTDQHTTDGSRQSLDKAFRRFTDRSWAE